MGVNGKRKRPAIAAGIAYAMKRMEERMEAGSWKRAASGANLLRTTITLSTTFGSFVLGDERKRISRNL
jgi:hypothetical protein